MINIFHSINDKWQMANGNVNIENDNILLMVLKVFSTQFVCLISYNVQFGRIENSHTQFTVFSQRWCHLSFYLIKHWLKNYLPSRGQFSNEFESVHRNLIKTTVTHIHTQTHTGTRQAIKPHSICRLMHNSFGLLFHYFRASPRLDAAVSHWKLSSVFRLLFTSSSSHWMWFSKQRVLCAKCLTTYKSNVYMWQKKLTHIQGWKLFYSARYFSFMLSFIFRLFLCFVSDISVALHSARTFWYVFD